MQFIQSESLFKHVKDLNVWHCRLDHPLKKVLECLSKNYIDIQFDKTIVCTPCHLAKQHILSFPLCKSVCKSPFDLIHIDIRKLLASLLYMDTNVFSLL